MLTFAKSNKIKLLNKKGLLTLRQLFFALFFTVFGNSFLCLTNAAQNAYATSTAVYSNIIDPSRAVSKWRTPDGALAVSSASTGDGATLSAANSAAAANTPAAAAAAQSANAATNAPVASAVKTAGGASSAVSTSVPVNSFGGKKGYVAPSNNSTPDAGASSGSGDAPRSSNDSAGSADGSAGSADGGAGGAEKKASDAQNFGVGTGNGNGSVSNSDSNGAKVSESEAAEDYYCEYKTKPNDDIVSISKYFHTTINEFTNSIANHNEIDFGRGMRMLVPIKHYTMQEGETMDSVAKKMNLDPENFAKFNQEYDSVKTDNIIMLPMLDTTRKVVVHPLNGANSNMDKAAEPKDEAKAAEPAAVAPAAGSADALSKDIIHQQSIPDDLPIPVAKPADYPHINNKDFDSFGNVSPVSASATAVPTPVAVPASVALAEKKDGKDGKNGKDKDAKSAVVAPAAPAISTKPTKEESAKKVEEPKSKYMLIWPAKGKLVSKFKEKSGDHGEGITIKANQGTDIKAAANGTVFYSGDGITSYGNLIILKHENGFMTLYGHNADKIVKKGDVVKSGQVIAHVGKTGSVKTPQLFFALRHNKKPVDPLKYMPPVSENK